MESKVKMGRPHKGQKEETRQRSVVLPVADLAFVEAAAKIEGVSINEMLRRAVTMLRDKVKLTY